MTDEVKVRAMEGELPLEIGDTVRLVCQGEGDKGDPMAFLEGTFVVLKTAQGQPDPEFGETVRAKIADIRESMIVAAVTEEN